MNFKERILKNIVEPSTSTKLTNAMGYVISYNPLHNLADVLVNHINNRRNVTLKDVPIAIPGNGMHQSALKQNDVVYVQFNNGSIFQPKIVSKADELFATHTAKQERHKRKGSLVSNSELTKKEDVKIEPSSKKWLKDYEKGQYKTGTKLLYKDKVARNPVDALLSEKGTFKNQDIGLYNPNVSSIVKLRDDGCIDIFTKADTGIRVNPETRTIELFGNATLNSTNVTVISKNVEIVSDAINLKAKKINLDSESIIINGKEI